MVVVRASLVLLVLWTGCQKSKDAPEAQTTEGEAPKIVAPLPRCARGVEPLPPTIERGVCVAHNYQRGGSKGYGSATSEATLQELRALGVDSVSLTPFGFMQRLDEPTVHSIGDYRAGETDSRIVREIKAAKALGLRIMLKPHLWIVDGQWRGHIDFESDSKWTTWFDAYEDWLLHYADLAEAHGVEFLVVGVELRTTEARLESRWRRLIRKVRRRYKGKITYSANWDDAGALPWWDAVDYVGVQFYPPLAKAPGARTEEVRRYLDARLDEVAALSARAERPVLFTEVGFRSDADALVRPHAWPGRSDDASVDEETQAIGYAEFVAAVRERRWVAGVYWWKWFTDPNTAEEGPRGFSPRGKPAESVLRAAYGGNCDAPNSGR
ncbi:MAG: hypothetical protein AAF436_11115 [Myxococcota bacterium]